jgi:hypothetical protein
MLRLVKKYNRLKSRILPWYQFSFLERRFTIRFILDTKFHYGPENTPEIRTLIVGTRDTNTLVNIFFLIAELRRTLSLVYANSYHRGLTIISGLGLERYAGIGARYFYFFSPWNKGFLTNFSILFRQTVLDKFHGRANTRHVPVDAIHVKTIPQLPSYSIALNLQHWACNEAASVWIPQTIAATSNQPLTQYHPTCTLLFNNSTVPSVIIMLLARESILSAKMDDKLFFLRDKINASLISPTNYNKKMIAVGGKNFIRKFKTFPKNQFTFLNFFSKLLKKPTYKVIK